MTEERHTFEWLQRFYQSCCDGEWEHETAGCSIIGSSDPGWSFTFDLSGTIYESVQLNELEDQTAPISWLRCKIEDSKFIAFCSPKRLAECIEILRDVVEGRRGTLVSQDKDPG